jgi:hypothetical protein
MRISVTLGAVILLGLAGTIRPAAAQTVNLFESGKLLATGGVSNLEGAGGGGISTWAVISGYGTKDAIGGNIHATYTSLPQFQVTSTGAAIGLYNRVELSYAHTFFDTGNTGPKLGLPAGFTFEQDVIGAKVRLFGDIVYDQDTLLPQVSVGMQYKTTNHPDILKAVGAKAYDGEDYYIAASKLFLDQSLLVNTTLRLTKANQLGILGFGGPRNNGYQPEFEGSVAYLITRQLAFGGEYRTMPSNLGFTKADDWKTIYAAYFLTHNASITVAYASLGTVATFKNQQGVYASLQVGF